MLSFLQSIFRDAGPSPGSEQRIIDAAIERVVDGTDRRFRAVGGYRRILKPPVTRSVEHVIALVDSMPAPVAISASAFAADRHLQAFFVSPDHLRETVSHSEDLQKFLLNAPPLPSGIIHCLLTLDCEERHVLGMALRGDAVSKDVVQVVFNFTHHRLVGMSASAEETRWELKKRAFDHLIQTALESLTAAREESEQLGRRQRLLRRKLAALAAADVGVGTLMDSSREAADMPEEISRQLATIESDLDTLQTDTATLEGQLARVIKILADPEPHLRLARTSLKLDAMGVRLEGVAAANAKPLDLIELVSGDRRRVALPGYLLQAELLPPRNFIEEASRRLQSNR